MGRKNHSVSIPRLYKASAIILKGVEKGDSLQSLITNSYHRNSKALSAIVRNCMNNDKLLKFILQNTEISSKIADHDVAKVLITELLWGRKHLIGDSKPVKIVLEWRERLEAAAEESGITVVCDCVEKPCYARINTLLTTVEGTIQRFVDEGWELTDGPDSYEDFLECINKLTEKQFVQDFHMDDVLVFPSKAKLQDHKMVENGSLLLQDKSSCLSAHLLSPEPGSVVLDMCAAPGMKTAHLASLMKNKGTLYAVDKDSNRFEKLEYQIQRLCGAHNCVKTILADATRITSEQCSGVQYILVNPTCSGTGRIKEIEANSVNSENSRRIQKLVNFQERLLVQALTAFPDVERVVYHTNSILVEENEKIIEKVLARVPWFQIASPKLKHRWEHRGDPEYPFGFECLVADRNRDFTDGFFVAILERIVGLGPNSGKTLKRKSNPPDTEWEVPKKKKQMKRKKEKMDTNQDD